MAEELKLKAHGKWRSIFRDLGVDAKILNGRHQPCPLCGGKDRFRFDNKRGDGDYYCNVCGPGDGFDLLRGINGIEFKEAAKLVESVIGRAGNDDEQYKPKPFARLRRISKGLMRVSPGDPVYLYLINRGLSKLPRTLKLHPGLAYYEDRVRYGTYPAMIALVRDNDRNGVTYHVTYLTKDGHKASVNSQKKAMSELGENGYCIHLYPVTREIMGVAEGIETAIAARVMFDVPTWATINSNGMESFMPPAGVKRVMVFGDNDTNFAGQAAAYKLAKRLVMLGYEVEVHIPKEPGDWNDELCKYTYSN